jgi:DNA helicase-2/ATP-dependent DNA helicase PcrA
MTAHLESLNERQRDAVTHGVGLPDSSAAGPLLIIAGAGSGKTNTLAHRVAISSSMAPILAGSC